MHALRHMYTFYRYLQIMYNSCYQLPCDTRGEGSNGTNDKEKTEREGGRRH